MPHFYETGRLYILSAQPGFMPSNVSVSIHTPLRMCIHLHTYYMCIYTSVCVYTGVIFLYVHAVHTTGVYVGVMHMYTCTIIGITLSLMLTVLSLSSHFTMCSRTHSLTLTTRCCPRGTLDTPVCLTSPSLKMRSKCSWLVEQTYLYCGVLFNPRHACAARVTVVVVSVCLPVCVCVCVCVCVKSHLTFGASVCPEHAVMYSVGNKGQKFVAFSLTLRCSRVTALAALYSRRAVGHFSLGEIHACASKQRSPDTPFLRSSCPGYCYKLTMAVSKDTVTYAPRVLHFIVLFMLNSN